MQSSVQGCRKCSALLTVPKSVVSSIIFKWKRFSTNRTLVRTIQLPKLSSWHRLALVRTLTKNPMTTLKSKDAVWRGEQEPTVTTALQLFFKQEKSFCKTRVIFFLFIFIKYIIYILNIFWFTYFRVMFSKTRFLLIKYCCSSNTVMSKVYLC